MDHTTLKILSAGHCLLPAALFDHKNGNIQAALTVFAHHYIILPIKKENNRFGVVSLSGSPLCAFDKNQNI